MAKISIIVPCYNAEQYIDDCVSSLVNQTIGISSLELIFVDDASTDATLQKLKQWERQYPEHILVITYPENKRQGGARNVGMQYATGEYIGFVDADDWVEDCMFEALYARVQDESYDAVFCDFVRDPQRPETMPVREVSGREAGRAEPDQVFLFQKKNGFYVRDTEMDGKYGHVWGAIYRRALWMENDIWFPEGMAYEDNYCSAILRLYIGSLCVVGQPFYHYYTNPDSTTSVRNQRHHLDRLAIEVGILEEYKRRGAYTMSDQELEWKFIQHFYLNSMFIFFTKFDRFPDVFPYIRDTVYAYFPKFMENPHCRECQGRKRFLLELLESEAIPEYEDMLRLQQAYLASYYADHR